MKIYFNNTNVQIYKMNYDRKEKYDLGREKAPYCRVKRRIRK